MFTLWIILSSESIEMFQLKKYVNKYDRIIFWLPARWDFVFPGDYQQIAIIVWNM